GRRLLGRLSGSAANADTMLLGSVHICCRTAAKRTRAFNGVTYGTGDRCFAGRRTTAWGRTFPFRGRAGRVLLLVRVPAKVTLPNRQRAVSQRDRNHPSCPRC